MASSSKQMDMPVLFLITASGLLLLAAGIVFAQGLFLQAHQAARFSPETAGATLSPESAARFAKQEAALHAAGHLDIQDAMRAEIDSAK